MNSKQQAAGGRQRRPAVFCFAVCCLLPAACCFAGEPPTFVLHSTRADAPAGPLVRLSADGTAQVGDSTAVPAADVVAIRRQSQAPPNFPHDRPLALFANGDRVPGRLLAIDRDKVRFLAGLGSPQEVTVPLSAFDAIVLTDKTDHKTSEKRRADEVRLTNGDTVAGTIIAWPADGPLRLDAGGREVALPRERVQALFLNSELARTPRPQTAYRQMVLTNGARLSVRTAELTGDELRATTTTGAAVRIPLAVLAAVNVYQGRAVYLSDLKPASYEHTPYLGLRWPVMADRSVAGGDLRLGGGTYDKGIGLHSRSRVSYALPAGAVRFEAVVGLDDLSGRSGGVQVQVLADGKPLLDPASELTAAEPPRSLRIGLPSGCRQLALVVDFGRGGDVQDHVDWADARIITGGAAAP